MVDSPPQRVKVNTSRTTLSGRSYVINETSRHSYSTFSNDHTKSIPINDAFVLAVGSSLPFQCFHLLKEPTKAVPRSSYPTCMAHDSSDRFIGNWRAPILGTWIRVYYSTPYGCGGQSPLPVSPIGAPQVPVNAVSMETSPRKLETSARIRNQFAIVTERRKWN